MPEDSDYTSIQQRIRSLSLAADKPESALEDEMVLLAPRMLPLVTKGTEEEHFDCRTVCDFRLMDYLELVDWTGREVRQGKRGAVAGCLPNILSRLQIDREAWLRYMKARVNKRLVAMGTSRHIKRYAAANGRKWVPRLNSLIHAPDGSRAI